MNSLSLANQSVSLGGDVQIAYYDSGNSGNRLPEGTAIVLLHGYCGSSSYWRLIAPMLEGLGRVVVPDLRGHGRSSAPAGDVYGMDLFAGDLEALLDKLGIRSVCLFGHSLGGYISLAFADRRPDLLKSFSLVHSTAKPDSDAAKAGRDKAARTIREQGIRPFVEELVPKLFAPAHRESMADSVREMIEVGSATSPSGAAATAMGMKGREDRRALLEALDMPRLLIAGSEDAVIPTENTFTAEGPGVSQVLLEGAGHMGMIEQTDRLGERISAFVRFVSTL